METPLQDYSVTALLAFLDWCAEKGKMNARTASGRRVACNRVFHVLDEHERQDVRQLNLDEVFMRFANLEGQGFTPESLREYRRRVEKSIADFLEYRRDPTNWRPSTGSRMRDKRTDRAEQTRTPVARSSIRRDELPGMATAVRSSGTPVYPYPLRPDIMVFIHNLPTDLTVAEARRLGAYLQTLAADYTPES